MTARTTPTSHAEGASTTPASEDHVDSNGRIDGGERITPTRTDPPAPSRPQAGDETSCPAGGTQTTTNPKENPQVTTKTRTTTATPAVTLPRLTGSTMSALHRDESGPLRPVLQRLPEWVEAAHALSHLATVRPERRNYASLAVELDELIAQNVESRQPFDVDAALTHAGRVSDRLNGRQALEDAFDRAIGKWTEQLDNAVRDNRDNLYAALGEQWTDLVEQARDLADVISISAETAVARDETRRWQDARSLMAAADRLRATRSRLESIGGWEDIGTQAYPELRWLFNPTEVFEHWRAWRVDGALVNPHNIEDRRPLTAPWPDYRYGRALGDEGGVWLAWFAQNRDAIPWVPSPTQYREVAEQLAQFAATRPASGSRTYEQTEPPQPAYLEHRRVEVRA